MNSPESPREESLVALVPESHPITSLPNPEEEMPPGDGSLDPAAESGLAPDAYAEWVELVAASATAEPMA